MLEMDHDLKEEDMEDSLEKKQLAVRHQDVKSTAVVKYTNVEMPALFHELQPNTNLNEPPANWMYGGSKLESYLRELSLGRERTFSSFKMAHCFPDQACEVDVISDGENIKKLLKIPYSKGHVSMIVHRVGATLLLDEFDIHKHLLRQQHDDWTWLREFYQNVILQNIKEHVKDKIIVKKNKRRDHLQTRDMFSKFLYHSVIGEEEEEGQEVDPSAIAGLTRGDANALAGIVQGDTRVEFVENQTMPDPLNEPRLDQTEHQRTVVWTFEDLHMLIGTDLPIFGGQTHPCVSLRLRDMAKPINVMTGLDYWLDNLMCNVPELAMCYHLNGIVQNYELMKTEDIPNIADSQFSPTVIKDIAQNILSFLKSNATKEGHTYWLFKGHGDDVVKLYDLTTLTEGIASSEQNPFMVPVGILLYRMARNMRQNSGRKKAGTIRTLLENCLLLLDTDTHPQVVTSAHYLLSDLFISDNIYNQELEAATGSGSDTDTDDESTTLTEDDCVEEAPGPTGDTGCEARPTAGATSVEVKALCRPQAPKKASSSVPHPPITGTVERRCEQALSHVAQGLICLDQNIAATTNPNPNPAHKHKCEDQLSADPDVPIPLFFPCHKQCQEPSANDSTTNKDGRSSPNQVLAIKRTTLPKDTWHSLSKTLLMRKAAVAYLALSEQYITQAKYGHALRQLKMALVCFCSMRQLTPAKEVENHHILTTVLGLAGDVHLMLAHNQQHSATYQLEYAHTPDYDFFIQTSVDRDAPEFEYGWLGDMSASLQQNLKRSVLSYEIALDTMVQSEPVELHMSSLKKRLGNVQNELGVHYMNLSATVLNEEGLGSPSERVQELWQSSYTCFVAGVVAFESLSDNINSGLLHSNCGRLMRLCARAYTAYDETGTQHQMGPQEKHFYSKAAEQYQQALGLLRVADRSSPCEELAGSVTWELSSTYFTWATTLQDHAPLSHTSQEQVEKEVTDLMMKALKYCESDVETARQATCQYRAATIHHRLGSLYHNAYRNQINDQKKKHQRTLADLHYSKGSHYFSLVDSPCEVVRIQLERVAMCEYQLATQTSTTNRLRTLQASLGHLTGCTQPVGFVVSQLSDPEEEKGELLDTYQAELNKLLPLLNERLAFTLQHMVRNATPPKRSKLGETHQHLAEYKAAYATVLKAGGTTSDTADLASRCRHLHDLLQKVATQCNMT